MKAFLLLAAISLVATTGWAQAGTNGSNLKGEEKAVWEKVLQLHGAVFGNKDAAVMEALTATGLHYGHSGGNIEDREEMVRKAAASATVYEQVTNEFKSIQIVNGAAMVRMVLRASSVENGKASPLNLGILQVWVKQKGQWKLLERQAVKIPAAS